MKRVMLAVATCLLLSSCGWTDPKDDGSSSALASSSTTAPGGDDADAAVGDGDAAANANGACEQAPFPTWLDGRPEGLSDAKLDGVYVFADKFGIHVRVKGSAEPPTVVDVVVTTDAPITVFKRRPETLPAESVANRYEASLQATPDGQGFDINPCKISRLSVQAKSNGQPWPTERLFVGQAGTAFGNPIDAARS